MVAEHGGRKSQRRKFYKRQRLTPGQKERFLKSREAMDLFGAGKVNEELKNLSRLKRVLAGEPLKLPEDLKRPQPGAIDCRGHLVEPMFEGGLRGGMACSSPWVDDNWEHGTPYPPGGDQTRMMTCKGCGRMTPPNCCGSSGHCDDCRYGAMRSEALDNLPSSTSCVDVKRLKASRRKHGPAYKGGI